VTGGATGNFGTSGFVFGGTAGANYQLGSLVFGVEADGDWADASGFGTLTATSLCIGGCLTKNTWLSTVRGRVGYAFDRFLIYGTAGAALGNVRANFSNDPVSSATKAGWTVGAGVEVGFARNWSFGRLHVRRPRVGMPACIRYRPGKVGLRKLLREAPTSPHVFISERRALISAAGYHGCQGRRGREIHISHSLPHAGARLRVQARQRRPRHSCHSGLSRPPFDHVHRALYGFDTQSIQELLERLTYSLVPLVLAVTLLPRGGQPLAECLIQADQ
jgi:Outer membrane protein beta-barrel domain